MAADQDPWLGRVIDGRYAVEAVLGRGGMGVVLRARHKFTGALAAVKMLHADLTRDPQIEARFLAEARAPNAIGHPAIVKVLDAGRTPEGELYLAMELLVGQPMRSAVSRRLGTPAIKRITLELLDALGAAHAHGFVHRDLKPENVFLADPDGAVKLLDFGIAKVLDANKTATLGTQAGVVLGTIAYMAPEQLRDAATVDARADLWALGVMIYEMLAGRLPYRGTTVEEVFVRLAREEPDPIRAWIPTIAAATEQFMARALARDPNARFRTAAEMATAFVALPLDQHAQVIVPRAAADSSPMATQATGFGVAPSTPGVTPISSPRSLPPANVAITPVPQLVVAPQPPPQAAPTLQTRGANRAAILGVAFGVAAAAVIAAAIFVAKHKKQSEPHGITTDLAIGSATPSSSPPAPPPADAAIAIEAAPAPVPTPPQPQPQPQKPRPQPQPRPQAHPQAQPQPQPQPRPPSGPQPEQPYPQQQQPQPQPQSQTPNCTESCALAEQCGLATATSCQRGCYQNPTTVNQCAASHDCNRFAACMIDFECHAEIFGGTKTCNQALSCQKVSCQDGNMQCGCRCALGLSVAHAAAIYSVDACYFNCGNGPNCAAICGRAEQACRAQ